MIEEGASHRVVEVEEIPDGRFPPGERGADLFGVGLLDPQHTHIDGPKRRPAGVGIAQQGPRRENLRWQEVLFPKRDLHLDELALSRHRRTVGESPDVLPRLVVPSNDSATSNQARRAGTPAKWSLIGEAALATLGPRRIRPEWDGEIQILAQAEELRMNFAQAGAPLEHQALLKQPRQS